jgi:hypothetical protein
LKAIVPFDIDQQKAALSWGDFGKIGYVCGYVFILGIGSINKNKGLRDLFD